MCSNGFWTVRPFEASVLKDQLIKEHFGMLCQHLARVEAIVDSHLIAGIFRSDTSGSPSIAQVVTNIFRGH